MKKTMTMGAMTVALLAAVGCSETETDLIINPGNDDQVSLGIAANLKVDASSKAATKSVVAGELITYDIASYSNADSVPGLGLVITNKDVSDWYSPDAGLYTGHHIWYMGSEKGADWKSIKQKETTFAATKEVPYYLTKEIGQVFAYYPYNKDFDPQDVSDLKLPIKVIASGMIDASTNNAKKYWKVSGSNGSWSSTPKTDQVNLALSTEKDYLYFAGTGGRYVNNGRAVGETPVKPDADPDNENPDNPGYKINLDMKHAMSMITFRVYDGGKLSTKNVNFTKFRIKNAGESATNPFKMGDGFMSLTDGTIIPDNLQDGDITRTISNYILMRQLVSGEKEDAQSFILNGTAVNPKQVCKTVSAIIYPTEFKEGDIEVIITLQEEGADAAVDYPVILPDNNWLANSNHVYTLSAGRNKLTVMDVSVEKWDDVEEDELPL